MSEDNFWKYLVPVVAVLGIVIFAFSLFFGPKSTGKTEEFEERISRLEKSEGLKLPEQDPKKKDDTSKWLLTRVEKLDGENGEIKRMDNKIDEMTTQLQDLKLLRDRFQQHIGDGYTLNQDIPVAKTHVLKKQMPDVPPKPVEKKGDTKTPPTQPLSCDFKNHVKLDETNGEFSLPNSACKGDDVKITTSFVQDGLNKKTIFIAKDSHGKEQRMELTAFPKYSFDGVACDIDGGKKEVDGWHLLTTSKKPKSNRWSREEQTKPGPQLCSNNRIDEKNHPLVASKYVRGQSNKTWEEATKSCEALKSATIEDWHLPKADVDFKKYFGQNILLDKGWNTVWVADGKDQSLFKNESAPKQNLNSRSNTTGFVCVK